MSTKKQLPIHLKPEIVCYSSHAKILSILATDDCFKGWFHNNYIHMCCQKDFKTGNGIHLDFYMGPAKDFTFYPINPWLFSQVIKKDLLNGMTDNVVDFVIQCIDLGYYVDIHLDQYHLPKDEEYGHEPTHFYHDTLIFGYDREQRSFDILGYTPFFRAEKVSFDQFEKAYRDCPVERWYTVFYLYSYQPMPDSRKSREGLDVPLIKESLESYLGSRNISRQFAMIEFEYRDFAYGMETYTYLRKNYGTGEYWGDIRPMYALWEHKKCMLQRIEVLYERGHLSTIGYEASKKEYEEIKHLTELIKQAQLKSLMLEDFSLIEKKFDTLISEIEEREGNALVRLIESLD
ncbi:hypothetical protein [Paenibacillus paeoniae]|uniref:Butirosin biosynthesis protein H N-terminal domain-containing protein n=1 Tax=Paenibacillus paeoniae TaxID=2292705 RepID=A0A371PFN5_9BACL|nr:hypothetical protein [Paenibacillus paeoniae]REK74757.1 hypothetical protein DX130_13890 [Paenibacillus paeoniae]